ncbi:hypothetical protein A3C23_00365 [Candidatus Roizmanbacteria bacterium RIFCSPHIGHO2_02_FULL_37_13b]|uniref:Uncharacterized protein n=1 Tax=Candidatus Roizmanbacteria bacterium RIFCSPLOWO2_02_FULL_36_11 TaxID=1802071 RepID=A0A1F7JBH1_9BACT|nr:MAG: hypothetical protein A3C23_00365 [Candidatus Roizmanbacteria bacterium RIFCSPHIGHO2_02_FULL_37_13b]OGK52956.1 MAG: hypothetical protein A3H78_02475 [Candidatus Roizmanbacteria bacterium RIFCSPLOWO2_02_FULL_36_11]
MIENIQHKLLWLLIYLFPIFFLPITQEYINTNKLYLLIFCVLTLLSLSLINLLIKGKTSFVIALSDLPVLLFTVATGLSVLISSPNKIEALTIPTGLGFILGLTALYFFIKSKALEKLVFEALIFSGLSVATISIILYSFPVFALQLPVNWQFLNNQDFSILGSNIHLCLFLGFVLMTLLFEFKIRVKKTSELFSSWLLLHYLFLIIIVLALIIGFSRLKSNSTLDSRITQSNVSFTTTVSPLSTSIDAAYSITANPRELMFGVGVDNYNSAFNRVKTPSYNKTSSFDLIFNQASNLLLQAMTETGLFGFITLIILVGSLIYKAVKSYFESRDGYGLYLCLICCYLLVMMFFPPSMIFLILLYLIQGVVNIKSEKKDNISLKINITRQKNLYLYFLIIIIDAVVLCGLFYFSSRGYLAEIYYKKSIDGLALNNSRIVYDNQKKAISLNPYIERFRISFSQFNLLLANNIVSSSTKKELSLSERQTITQAVQQAISEGKTAVSLNGEKASNWENLGFIYRNIIPIVNGADVWAISSYQRAIALDPVNPLLRLNLGGIFYSIKDYQNAIKEFQKASNLKSDWPNAYYNLAWTYWETGNNDRAIYYLRHTLTFLKPQSANYKKVTEELESFEKQTVDKKKTVEPVVDKASDLTLPQDINQTTIEKLDVIKEASPTAK